MPDEDVNRSTGAEEGANRTSRTPTFALATARIALEQAPQAQRIVQLVDAIEQIPTSNPELVFDLCRALIESVCKTILADLGEPLPSNPNAENMVALLLKRLHLFLDPKSVEAGCKQAVGDTVGGIHKFVDGIGYYRRLFGPASHGRDGYGDAVDLSHARLVVGVTDALVSFLFSTHRRMHGEEEWQRAVYGDHSEFDRYLDDEHDPSPIMIFGDVYSPSQVLFSVNKTGYVKRLNDWRKLLDSGEIEPEVDE
jgi:hypothetical protein